MGKMDIKQAYRMVPVHPDDRHLLGMRWQGAVYVDKVLPFGPRSAPLIFTAVADALQWMMEQNGAMFIDHYLDDFVTVGKPDSEECASNLKIMHETCNNSGTPVEEDKSEGPATLLPFPGIEFDTTKMELRLPEEKLKRLKRLWLSGGARKSAGRRNCNP